MTASGPIVVGIDGSPSSMAALAWAFDEACRRGATLHVVHAWALPAFDGMLGYPLDVGAIESAARQVLETSITTLPSRPDGADITSTLVRGLAAPAVLEAAEGAELVVVGSHGRGPFSELLLGSVSHEVVNHAKCPVVVVRAPAPVEAHVDAELAAEAS
jgi:nucleotide-binding universal stress UspA family protein